MKRRTVLMVMLLGLGIASFLQVASALSSPLIGTWKLNVEKSKSDNKWIATEDAIERLMQTAGCSRRQVSKALSTYGSLAFNFHLWSQCEICGVCARANAELSSSGPSQSRSAPRRSNPTRNPGRTERAQAPQGGAARNVVGIISGIISEKLIIAHYAASSNG
jgi:hypothetical protein